jgi:hypothetical protein
MSIGALRSACQIITRKIHQPAVFLAATMLNPSATECAPCTPPDEHLFVCLQLWVFAREVEQEVKLGKGRTTDRPARPAGNCFFKGKMQACPINTGVAHFRGQHVGCCSEPVCRSIVSLHPLVGCIVFMLKMVVVRRS